jgi:AraC family transcriptional regulator
MRRAQDLLVTSAAPLSHVALECGLYDQAHFSRAFRRNVGFRVAPGRFWERAESVPVSDWCCQLAAGDSGGN